MKIYTRTGDRGDTSLVGGQRIPKDDLRVEAYGTIDELNAVLGIVLADNAEPEIHAILNPVQHRLFNLGADLAAPRSVTHKTLRRVHAKDTRSLERAIDALQQELAPLKRFILPGGSPTAARLHFARTVCRRAERAVVRLARREEIGDGSIVYLNRLSDLLFVLARFANCRRSIDDVKWKP